MSLTVKNPTCSAAWRSTDAALQEKEKFAFLYNSDCRGRVHLLSAGLRKNPPDPDDLPTYDELIGQQGVTEENYNEHLFFSLRSDHLNILTIHAEV